MLWDDVDDACCDLTGMGMMSSPGGFGTMPAGGFGNMPVAPVMGTVQMSNGGPMMGVVRGNSQPRYFLSPCASSFVLTFS